VLQRKQGETHKRIGTRHTKLIGKGGCADSWSISSSVISPLPSWSRSFQSWMMSPPNLALPWALLITSCLNFICFVTKQLLERNFSSLSIQCCLFIVLFALPSLKYPFLFFPPPRNSENSSV